MEIRSAGYTIPQSWAVCETSVKGGRRFGEDLFLAHARARARGRATRRAASPRTLRAHKRCAHGQARPAARTSCGGAVSGSDPSAQRRRRPMPTPSAAQLNPSTVGCELLLTASRPPERVYSTPPHQCSARGRGEGGTSSSQRAGTPCATVRDHVCIQLEISRASSCKWLQPRSRGASRC